MSNSKIDPSAGQFIDPMFAVVIAAAVAETIVVWTKGPSLPSLFSICVAFVGYVNLLLSWFGYHKSILRKPIRGGLRFIITVTLLPLYLLTIIFFNKNILCIALVYSMIFFLWSTWEYFRNIEHQEPKSASFLELQCKGYNLIVYGTTIFLVLAPSFPMIQKNWVVANSNWFGLTAIFISIIYLRLSKSAGNGNTAVARIMNEVRTLSFGHKQET